MVSFKKNMWTQKYVNFGIFSKQSFNLWIELIFFRFLWFAGTQIRLQFFPLNRQGFSPDFYNIPIHNTGGNIIALNIHNFSPDFHEVSKLKTDVKFFYIKVTIIFTWIPIFVTAQNRRQYFHIKHEMIFAWMQVNIFVRIRENAIKHDLIFYIPYIKY